MLLSGNTLTRLLSATETNSLVFLCGAGLSMAAPSNLPSALQISRKCYDAWQPVTMLPIDLREDIDRLAGHFHTDGTFGSIFLKRLVPWNELDGFPNDGHAAVADLLVCHGARGVLTANFDRLIEQWAGSRKIELRGALDGQEAMDCTVTNPLLKFHGCMIRDRERTLWTQAQLNEPDIDRRIKSCSEWMNLTLPGKHLVVVGFWTDWGYLNEVLANAFTNTNASSVTVIDPSSTHELECKAPLLWQKLNALSNTFEHVQGSGDVALAELRTGFSKIWARKYFTAGANVAGSLVPDIDTLSGDDLYNLRRDAEGVAYNRAATLASPPASATQAAYLDIKLLTAGAVYERILVRICGNIHSSVKRGGRRATDSP